ncbi:MAG TPA: SulP family inorganic anion transporter, partial [Amaricoccus sp.]|nr:SulP family inorganic anion transporter [Amaricoccus sp.]
MTFGTGAAARLRPLAAAAVVGPMAIAFNISAAGIIYQGPLTAFLDRAIALNLIAATVMAALSTILFSYRGTVSQPQNMIAVILSVPAANIALAAGPVPVGEATFSTVAALVAVTALATGVVTWLLGRWRLGFVARFIPFPVLAGFLAATGYMLILGGLGMAVGRHVDLRGLGVLFEPGNPGRWLPWTVAAIAIAGLSRRWGPMVLPAGLLAAAAAFYGVFAFSGLGAARDAGLLLGPFGGAFLPALDGWQPFAFDGGAVLAATPSILVAIGLSVASAVLSASSIEALAGTRVDTDRDLRAVGIVNLVSGAGGGSVGYHSISLVALARGLGAGGRSTGWTVAAAGALALLVGAPVISALPVGLFSTGVMVIGLNLLVTPLVDQRRGLPAGDYAVVAIIPVAAAIFGFLWGVGVGILAAALFFIMAFARIDLVRLETTASRIRSRVERPPGDQAWLAQRGGAARIYVLAGFVFFGTAHRLASRIEASLAGEPRPRFVLLDFRQVRGIDVSAARSLVGLEETCRAAGVTLVASGLNPAAARLVRGQSAGEGPRILPTLAEALEEVEAALLADVPAASAPAILESLRERHPGADLAGYLREVAVEQGAEVIGQGAPSDFLLVLTSGMLRTELRRGDGASVVIARCLPGALVGE